MEHMSKLGIPSIGHAPQEIFSSSEDGRGWLLENGTAIH